jgi:cobalamin biosynthesis Mg chelatase CobN
MVSRLGTLTSAALAPTKVILAGLSPCGSRQASETYALDEDMAAKLRKSNPQAFANVLKRMLEAAGRGMWQADPTTLDRLRAMYADMDDELEGVSLR